MTKKKLVILALAMLVILIALIVIMSRINDSGIDNGVKTVFKSNSEKLIDYGQNIMTYGNKTYIMDNISRQLLQFDENTKNTTVLLDFSNVDVNDKFFIRNNSLIYSYGDNSYYSDLKAEERKQLTNGEVVYIDDNIYMYIYHGDTKDELYIVSYDNTTFRLTTELSHLLATGRSIKFLKQDGDCIYFTSYNSNDTISLFEIDLNTSKSTIVSRMNSATNHAGIRREYGDVLKDKENYYYIIKEISKTTEDEALHYTYLYRRPIDGDFEEIIAENVGPYLTYRQKNKKTVLFEEYGENGSSNWMDTSRKEISISWKNLRRGDVTSYFEKIGTSLYTDNEKLVDLGGDVLDYSIEKIVRLEGRLYILIKYQYSYRWYECTENGEDLVLIYGI